MAGIKTRIKAAIHSRLPEMTIGGIKGQLLRLRKPGEYKKHRAVRGSRSELVKQRKKAVKIITEGLSKEGIKPKRVLGRVKTIGSFKRRADYANKIFPKDIADQYVMDDLIGIKIILGSYKECKEALNKLEASGTISFTSPTGDRPNPRDYRKMGDSISRQGMIAYPTISSTILIDGIPTRINLQISTERDYLNELAGRGKYKKNMAKLTKS